MKLNLILANFVSKAASGFNFFKLFQFGSKFAESVLHKVTSNLFNKSGFRQIGSCQREHKYLKSEETKNWTSAQTDVKVSRQVRFLRQ